MKIRLLEALLLALAFLGISCSGGDPLAGGGNDFPNSHTTIAALGRRIASDLDSYDGWNDSLATPGTVPSVSSGLPVDIPDAPAGSALGKRAAAAGVVESLSVDLSDTALGLVRVTYTRSSDTTIEHASLVFLYDEAWNDNRSDNEHLFESTVTKEWTGTGRVDVVRYVDTDGDSIINNLAATVNRARIEWRSSTGVGITTRAVLRIDAGEDGDLETESDNRYLESEVLVTAAQDTVTFYRFDDMDGDSIVVDMGSTDSAVVLVTSIQRGFQLEPRQKRVDMQAVFVIFAQDSTRNYPIRWWGRELLRNGETTETSVFGQQADSTFLPGDTAVARVVTRKPVPAVRALDTTQMTILMGPVPQDTTDEALLSARSHSFLRGEDENEALFAFASDRPVGNGSGPESGEILLELTYGDGEWVNVEASFDSTGIRGTVATPSITRHVHWDRAGVVAQ